MKTFTKLLLCAWFGWSANMPIVQAAPTVQPNDKQAMPKAEDNETTSEKRIETPESIVTDVALSGKEGVLLGQVVDSNGKALASHSVRLTSGNRILARGKTNLKGYFAFRHLKGGVYQVASKDSFSTVRAWSNGTAPKSAKPKMLLVVGRKTVRAQQTPQGESPRGKRIRRLLKNPIVVAGIVTTAIAVPLSVNDSKTNSQGSTTPVPEVAPAVGGIPASQ